MASRRVPGTRHRRTVRRTVTDKRKARLPMRGAVSYGAPDVQFEDRAELTIITDCDTSPNLLRRYSDLSADSNRRSHLLRTSLILGRIRPPGSARKSRLDDSPGSTLSTEPTAHVLYVHETTLKFSDRLLKRADVVVPYRDGCLSTVGGSRSQQRSSELLQGALIFPHVPQNSLCLGHLVSALRDPIAERRVRLTGTRNTIGGRWGVFPPAAFTSLFILGGRHARVRIR